MPPERQESYDALVVGAGIAGLTSALAAADAEARVALVAKASPLDSSSWLAQGGLAAALDPGDSVARHTSDTLRAGRGLCRPGAVRVLCAEAPARIADLVSLGVAFDDGLGLEGGHSRRRIVHAGGAATGQRVARTLAGLAAVHPNVAVLDRRRLQQLWTAEGRCVGVMTDRGPIAARATVLATGGMAALWARTTNPSGSAGEGVALAYRAGAAVADLELVQFHPTVLAGGSCLAIEHRDARLQDTTPLLLTEALRGEGAVLLDGEGLRFTDELAPRDIVAREIEARGTALLDLRRVDRRRFASLMARIVDAGYDPASRPVPVAPAAHYTMGGIVTDHDGRTELPGLLAAGECACTGVHGANRLASNSLVECLVFGRRAAHSALEEPALPATLPDPPEPAPDELVTPELRRAMWEEAGLVRDGAGLDRLRSAPHLLARLVARAASARTESRGGHFRVDFPHEDPSLAAHIVHRPGREPAFERWA